MGDFTISTPLAAPAGDVWSRACSLEGVNHELGPYLRMTTPAGLRGRSIDDLRAPVHPGRSWLLLGGILPVDYDDLGIVELEPPRRFLERSQMLTMSRWQHEREVDPLGPASCTVTDRLAFTLRRPPAAMPGAEALAARLVAATFRHRHRRLTAWHGPAEPR